MVIVTIKTDAPLAELSLFDDSRLIEAFSWEAHRQLAETINIQLMALLQRHDIYLEQVKGFGCHAGPGSFTGLRIGLTVANALAYGLDAAVVAAKGDNWRSEAVSRLLAGETETIAIPEYGMPVHITLAKK